MSKAIQDPSFFQTLFSAYPDAIYVIDAEHYQLVSTNHQGLEYLGLTTLPKQYTLAQIDTCLSGIGQLQQASETPQAGSAFSLSASINNHPVEITTTYLTYESQGYFICTVRQIHTDHALQPTEYIHAFALNALSDGIWDWDMTNNLLNLNDAWFKTMGYDRATLTNPELEVWENAIHLDDKQRVMEDMQRHIKGLTPRYESKYRLKNYQGEYMWVQDRGVLVARDAEGHPTRMVGMVLDITDAQNKTARLLSHARYDDLTGLYNRKTGYQLFAQYLESSRQQQLALQVVLFDLDHFKQFNDQHGHLNGDKALKHFTRVLKTHIRKHDLLFRWGGEEFLLLCPDTQPADAIRRITDLLKILEQSPLLIDGQQLYITASAGISSFPEDGHSIEELVEGADIAMYQAKAAGRNRAVSLQPLSG